MSHKPTIIVVYGNGSLSPTRIREVAKTNECNLLFVVPETPHAREMLPVLKLAGAVVEVNGRAETEIVAELRIARSTGIVTFSESQIGFTAALAAMLELPYHGLDDLEAITHKDRQREKFTEAGLDRLRVRAVTKLDQLDDAISYVGLPAIIKPIVGASSRNTVAVSTFEECRRAMTTILEDSSGVPRESAVLLEQLLIGKTTEHPWGDYIAVDCVASGDDVAPIFVTSKFALAAPFRERGGYGGSSVVSEADIKHVKDLACRAVRALNIRQGIADVEIKLTESGPRVIEVNGRLGAWVDDLAVRSKTSDPADIAIKSALGRNCVRPDLKSLGPIAYHYLIVPPIEAKSVRSISHVDELRRIDRVDVVSVLKQKGDSVDWRLGANANVAAVVGIVDSHEELAAVVSEIERTSWITYD
ncbi:ATP-grasp domain-containing protein [Streptomyces rhizosphaericus]|uniref:ATP-grasp domain-containing protein n=1 Tax=Streptomyces rhizosphaericus TaxID=114699 RepID=A0A6G4ACL9_9ACTN|nr:ATP-grasp domain-containing protein [Streptomyces rhizosphaericus]NEW71103.1 ATP-grasp domain-containing protein [Streptomyces rhizosphaericus]